MKVKFTIYSPFVGADITETFEIDDEELAGMNEEERNKYIDDYCRDWMMQTIEYGWEEIND